ncbi:MAG: radical SAM protein, partial [Anaerolineae bacterium]
MDWKLIAEAKRILDKEEGTIYKNWGGKLAIALIYPNIYYVGMSNLGLQTVYYLFNQQADVVCERVFHKGREARDEGGELISLESQRPLDDFSLLAFSISFEMDYFNVVEILRQAGIPPLAEERNESHPLLIAGGSAVTANPEPLALTLDAIVIGQAEVIILPFVQA